VEFDATVHGAIRANAARNGVGERVRVATALPAGDVGYDLVVANIVADVLLEHAVALSAALRNGPEGARIGGLVLSGLRGHEVDRVAGRYRDLLGIAPRHAALGDWHCLRFG
jgi:ribosomal protein L11 methylase PrmA